MSDYCVSVVSLFLFFFKQKTAYEMRISDWSSDVCSSDLHRHPVGKGPAEHRRVEGMRAFLVGRRQLVPVALAHAVAAERGAVLVARAAHHVEGIALRVAHERDRKSTRLNSSH